MGHNILYRRKGQFRLSHTHTHTHTHTAGFIYSVQQKYIAMSFQQNACATASTMLGNVGLQSRGSLWHWILQIRQTLLGNIHPLDYLTACFTEWWGRKCLWHIFNLIPVQENYKYVSVTVCALIIADACVWEWLRTWHSLPPSQRCAG